MTPFVSILKDIKMKKDFNKSFKVKRAYFFWINNDAENMLWFSGLINGSSLQLHSP